MALKLNVLHLKLVFNGKTMPQESSCLQILAGEIVIFISVKDTGKVAVLLFDDNNQAGRS